MAIEILRRTWDQFVQLMKGTFFQRPLEFNILIDGETWNQGDSVQGTLTIKNHGSSPALVNDLRVDLAHGDLKKVRQKSPEAFKSMTTATYKAEVAPQSSTSFDWKFETDRNCPITDNSGSLFILYGKGTALDQLGHLELAIQPYWIIQEFLKTINIQYRFVVKTQKATKGWVEVKLAPPDSQLFVTVEHLILSFRFNGETLEVKYLFNVKAIEATASSFDVKKKKKECVQTFEPSQYLTSFKRFNHEHIEQAIKSALELVQAKVLY
jgi:hypothetical protein